MGCKPTVVEDLLSGLPNVVTAQSTPFLSSVQKPKRVKKAKVTSSEEKDPKDVVLIPKLTTAEKRQASINSANVPSPKKLRSSTVEDSSSSFVLDISIDGCLIKMSESATC
ncbi:hypothetical protein CsSME_00037250 [Camellia sinensis var. sinensis]